MIKLIRRLWRAGGHSLNGIATCFLDETAFRLEVLIIVPLGALAVMLPVSAVEKSLLLASLLLVAVVELLNTAIEAVCDRIGKEPHPLVEKAKDAGSAAVLLTLGLAVAVWTLILLP